MSLHELFEGMRVAALRLANKLEIVGGHVPECIPVLVD
jgi:hypothetical protein